MNQYMTPELYAVMPEIIEGAAGPLQDNDHSVRNDFRNTYLVRQPSAVDKSGSWR